LPFGGESICQAIHHGIRSGTDLHLFELIAQIFDEDLIGLCSCRAVDESASFEIWFFDDMSSSRLGVSKPW
jgi:hypothetical protein